MSTSNLLTFPPPLDADAPLTALLSVSTNPLLASMTEEELMTLVGRLRNLGTSAQALGAELSKEAKKTKTAKTKKPSLLDEL